MRHLIKITAWTIMAIAASPAIAQSKIDALCGPRHVNELTSDSDVLTNPDGYYVRSLGEQIRHGDPRLIQAVGTKFHLCTRSAATPDMDASRALPLMNERRVKYLFVPCPKQSVKPAS